MQILAQVQIACQVSFVPGRRFWFGLDIFIQIDHILPMARKEKETFTSIGRDKLAEHIASQWDSQTQFAEHVGINPPQLHDYLNGRRRPNLELAVKILRLTESIGTKYAIRPEDWVQEE